MGFYFYGLFTGIADHLSVHWDICLNLVDSNARVAVPSCDRGCLGHGLGRLGHPMLRQTDVDMLPDRIC